MKAILLITVATLALAACGGTLDEPLDVALGLEEAAACKTPSWYCTAYGMSYSGCAAEGAPVTSCWYAGNGTAWTSLVNAYPDGWRFGATYQYGAYYPWNNSCHNSSNYFYVHFGEKCTSYRNFWPNRYEQHLVYNSICTGYVECYEPV